MLNLLLHELCQQPMHLSFWAPVRSSLQGIWHIEAALRHNALICVDECELVHNFMARQWYSRCVAPYGQNLYLQLVGCSCIFQTSFERPSWLSSKISTLEIHLKSDPLPYNHFKLIPWIEGNLRSGTQSGASAEGGRRNAHELEKNAKCRRK